MKNSSIRNRARKLSERKNQPVTTSQWIAPGSYHLWLVVTLAVASVLRFYALGSVPHGFTNDEAQDGLSARQAIEQGLQVFYPENNGREGLYVNLSTPLLMAFGNTIWAIRLTSAACGVLTVWLTYLVGARLFSRSIALVSAFLIATSTWSLFNSRLTNRANAAPLFLLLTVYLLLRMTDDLRSNRPCLHWALLGGAAYGLGFHSYTSFRVTPVLIAGVWIYYLAQYSSKRGNWRSLLAAAACFTGAALAVVAPLALYFLRHPLMLSLRSSQVAIWSRPDAFALLCRNIWSVAQMFFLQGDTDWKNNIAGERELFWPVAIMFALGVAVAARAVSRRQTDLQSRFAFGLVLAWLAVGALPSVLTIDGIHALRASLMIPPVFLLAGTGVARVASWLSPRISAGLRTPLIICAAVLLCAQCTQAYFFDWAIDPHVARDFENWLVDEAVEIRDAPTSSAKYVAIPRPVFGTAVEVPQVILYLTATSTPKGLQKAGIHYVFPTAEDQSSPSEFCANVYAAHRQDQVFCVARDLKLRR